MKRFIETVKNIWKIEDLRNKILLTLGLILVYRIGSFIVIPGIDPKGLSDLTSGGQGILGLLDMFVGGAFSNASIFALGIMPYISASIAMQLLTLAVPYFQKMQKEGESGRKKITQMTRYLTVAVTALQSFGYIQYLQSTAGPAIVADSMFLFTISTVIVLTAGTVFCMWLGEKITDKGIGNGISLLITIGIIAQLPFAVVAEYSAKISDTASGGLVKFLIEIAFLVAIIAACVLLVQGVRKIPVQYAKRIRGNRQFGGSRQYIPLKINASGVMPIIFAQALMFIPSLVAQLFPDSALMASMQSGAFMTSFWYNAALFSLVVLFTYFYTALIINPTQMADDMKRNGGFIPGVKPGRKTADFIDTVLSRITLPGSIFLGLVAILPAFAMIAGINTQFAIFYGGTSLLILVAVMLDTLQQIESHLLMRHYDGLMKGGRIKGRGGMVGASV